jgi:hypothetical protein
MYHSSLEAAHRPELDRPMLPDCPIGRTSCDLFKFDAPAMPVAGYVDNEGIPGIETSIRDR